MSFGGIKEYALIHLDFRTNAYKVFKYKKDRRLTANQAWKVIRNDKSDSIGQLDHRATINTYDEIVEKLGFNPKYCDRYVTFKGMS